MRVGLIQNYTFTNLYRKQSQSILQQSVYKAKLVFEIVDNKASIIQLNLIEICIGSRTDIFNLMNENRQNTSGVLACRVSTIQQYVRSAGILNRIFTNNEGNSRKYIVTRTVSTRTGGSIYRVGGRMFLVSYLRVCGSSITVEEF